MRTTTAFSLVFSFVIVLLCFNSCVFNGTRKESGIPEKTESTFVQEIFNELHTEEKESLDFDPPETGYVYGKKELLEPEIKRFLPIQTMEQAQALGETILQIEYAEPRDGQEYALSLVRHYKEENDWLFTYGNGDFMILFDDSNSEKGYIGTYSANDKVKDYIGCFANDEDYPVLVDLIIGT